MINRIWLDEANKTVDKIEKERFINNEWFYKYWEPKDITKKRLIQIFDLWLREVWIAHFWLPWRMSWLYIESIWSDTSKEWNSYIRWVKTFLPLKNEKEAKLIIKQLENKVNNTTEKVKFPNLTSIIKLLNFYDLSHKSWVSWSIAWIKSIDWQDINIDNTDKNNYSRNTFVYAYKIIDVLKEYNII